jgi:hypothetical protein
MKYIFILLISIPFVLLSIENTNTIDEKLEKNSNKSSSKEINVIAKENKVSSSEGTITSDKIQQKAIYSVGDIADLVPGVISSGHSGLGKANQYFLRGFNLDHGTDFATSVDGVIVNKPSHVHGQGYNDLNFIIPELIQEIRFKKGVYSVEDGNFSSAGSMKISYLKKLDKSIVKTEGGELGHRRILYADSFQLGRGNFLIASEYQQFNGPWTVPDQYRKLNSVLGYSIADENKGISVKLAGYQAKWNATNQIPERAIQIGRNDFIQNGYGLNRFDSGDPSDGGKSKRASITLEAFVRNSKFESKFLLYNVYDDIDLFSNFTFYLKNQVLGDQIQQKEFRNNSGIQINNSYKNKIFGYEITHNFGIHIRRDYIQNQLNNSYQRNQYEPLKENRIIETNISPFYELQTSFTERIKTFVGARGEIFNFNIEDRLNQNQFDENKRRNQYAKLLNPKLGVIINIYTKSFLFMNAGYGFHSNDARGFLDSNLKVTPISQTKGEEIGIQTNYFRNFSSTLTLWKLNLESELVFQGDEGTTSPTRSSTRRGVEFINQYNITKELTINGDFAISRARYIEYDFSGNTVPLSARTIISSGLNYVNSKYTSSLLIKYFGSRPLDEKDSIHSSPMTNVNFMISRNFDESWNCRFEVFNLLNQSMDRVQYYYPTRLKNEPIGSYDTGYNDRVVSPMPGRNIRIIITKYL